MMKAVLIGLLAGMFCLSSAELNKEKLLAELKELTRELRTQAEEGKRTIGDPEVAEDIPKAPIAVTEDVDEVGVTAEPEPEDEVKVSALEKLFSKLGGVLGKRLEKVAKRYEKRARKVREIANRISEELDMKMEHNAIEDLAAQFENTAESLRQVATETETYFDGADEKLQDIMSQAPSGRHISHLRKKVKAAKNANRGPAENQVLSIIPENTDGDFAANNIAADNAGSDVATDKVGDVAEINNVGVNAATDNVGADLATNNVGADAAVKGSGAETGANTDGDAGSKRTLNWLVNELRENARCKGRCRRSSRNGYKRKYYEPKSRLQTIEWLVNKLRADVQNKNSLKYYI